MAWRAVKHWTNSAAIKGGEPAHTEPAYESPRGVRGKHPVGVVLGPATCMGCGLPVYWARGQTRFGWNGPVIPGPLGWRDPTGGRHHCGGTIKRSAPRADERAGGRRGRNASAPPAA